MTDGEGTRAAGSASEQTAPAGRTSRFFFSSWQVVILLIAMPFVAFGAYYGAGLRLKTGFIELNIDQFVHQASQGNSSEKSGDALNVGELKTKLKSASRDLPVARVLWFDDRPNNNLQLRQDLALIGVFCDSYSNADDAVQAANEVHYDMVISNGWDHDLKSNAPKVKFLKDIRSNNLSVPFLFYSNSHFNDPDIVVAANVSHADRTSYATDVLNWVVEHIPKKQ
jgi:hypothetical protein